MVDVNIKKVSTEKIKVIEKAATIQSRSRSNFMIKASLDTAKKIIKNDEEEKQ